MNSKEILKIKHFSFLHLYVGPLLFALIYSLNFSEHEAIFEGTPWLDTLSFIVINCILGLGVIMCRIFLITTVFDKKTQTVTSYRYTFLGRYSSKVLFKDITKVYIDKLHWGGNSSDRKHSLFICIKDDEIPIIESKNHPPGCVEEEKKIREFIGLAESKEDESSPTQ
jgi:hypothetical protein